MNPNYRLQIRGELNRTNEVVWDIYLCSSVGSVGRVKSESALDRVPVGPLSFSFSFFFLFFYNKE